MTMRKLSPYLKLSSLSPADKPMVYLQQLTYPKHRAAFSSARFNALPSAVLEGRYRRTPYQNRVCICGNGNIENIAHVLLFCPLYRNTRKELITPLLLPYPGRPTDSYVNFLLEDHNRTVTANAAKFLAITMRAAIASAP